MRRQDTREISWLARRGRLHASVSRYRCPPCRHECRPLLDLLGVEPGRISGALARLLALLATVAPYPLAARLAWLLLGVTISPMGVWRVTQRLGEAVAHHSEALSRYHADSRSTGAPTQAAPSAVVLGVDGCSLGMQVRSTRRRRKDGETLPPLPPIEEGRFREVKTGVLLLPSERVETSPGRRAVVRRCEILDFWRALEHAWESAQLRYGEGSAQADRWVHEIAEDLRAGKVQEVIARLKRVRPKTPELRASLQALIRYYSENASRMRYDEYLRLGYGIGSGAVESAHKQVVHARFRQAGMRWSEAGARRLLALRLLLLNDNWALLDRLRMVSLA